MIALEACLILETITAIPLSGAHSCLAQDSAQQLRARRGRNDASELRRSAAQHGGGAATNSTAAEVPPPTPPPPRQSPFFMHTN